MKNEAVKAKLAAATKGLVAAEWLELVYELAELREEFAPASQKLSPAQGAAYAVARQEAGLAAVSPNNVSACATLVKLNALDDVVANDFFGKATPAKWLESYKKWKAAEDGAGLVETEEEEASKEQQVSKTDAKAALEDVAEKLKAELALGKLTPQELAQDLTAVASTLATLVASYGKLPEVVEFLKTGVQAGALKLGNTGVLSCLVTLESVTTENETTTLKFLGPDEYPVTVAF